MSLTDAQKKARDEAAEQFENDVYMADPEMIDSPPSKLWSCGHDFAHERARVLEEYVEKLASNIWNEEARAALARYREGV